MIKKTILVFCSLLIQHISFGQEEANFVTIIFNDSTTVKGFGEIKRNKILFKLTKQEEFTEWSYDMVKGIVFSGYGYVEKYEYIKPDKYTEPKIMEVLETGEVSLYKRWKTVVNINILNNNINILNDFPTPIVSDDPFREYDKDLNGFNKEPILYIKRQHEKNATDINFSFKTRALRYFADCEIAIKKIKNKTFNIDNIPELISYYNNYCYEEEK